MQTVAEAKQGLTQAVQLGAPPARERKRSSRDALPEFTRYRDEGCEVSPSCFSCPLPRCRYEEPGGLRAILNESRDRQILQLRMEGLGVDELAGRFGVSRRTVFRIIGSTKVQVRVRKRDDGGPVPIRVEHTRKEAHCA